MKKLAEEFINAYWSPGVSNVYTKYTPREMMLYPEKGADKEGWFKWKPIKGTLSFDDYRKLEKSFGFKYPKNFIEWHKEYLFMDGDCSFVRLPSSNPNQPLKELIDNLDWPIPEVLIPQGLIPFADDGNDTGPWVFDTREAEDEFDCPIRIYDHEYGGDLDGLSSVAFSSFRKMMECLIYYLKADIEGDSDLHIYEEFSRIDPENYGFWEDMYC